MGGGTQGAGREGVAGDRGNVQSPVEWLRGPVRIVLSWRVTVTADAVKITVQPWLHNWLTEMRAPDFKWGNIWAWRAASGNGGKERRAVWVE